MDATILDIITSAFVQGAKDGAPRLLLYTIPLLGVLAVISYYAHMGPVIMSGGQLGDVLATFILTIIGYGIFYYLLINFIPLTTAALLTFIQWGVAVGGVYTSPEVFLKPSSILILGFQAGEPIIRYVQKYISWSALFNLPTLLIYLWAYVVIVIAIAFVALHLSTTIIEFYFAAMVGIVMVPFSVLSHTAFFAEFGIAWIAGSLVRAMITIGIVALGTPFFEILIVKSTAGGDPTLYSALVTLIASVIFAIYSWVIPARAAGIAGRGTAIALTGGTLIRGLTGGAVTTVDIIRGTSKLIGGR